MSIRDDLAALIARIGNTHVDADNTDFHGQIVDTILARYGVVELPEPVRCDDDLAEDLEDPFEFRGPWGTYFVNYSGDVGSDTGLRFSPPHARAEAAALLAAANRAEAQS